jgi:hypothetical protein
MTIIQEEKLTLKSRSDDILRETIAEVRRAMKEDAKLRLVDDTKKRLALASTSYKEFKDLISTIELKPFRRVARRVANDAH